MVFYEELGTIHFNVQCQRVPSLRHLPNFMTWILRIYFTI